MQELYFCFPTACQRYSTVLIKKYYSECVLSLYSRIYLILKARSLSPNFNFQSQLDKFCITSLQLCSIHVMFPTIHIPFLFLSRWFVFRLRLSSTASRLASLSALFCSHECSLLPPPASSLPLALSTSSLFYFLLPLVRITFILDITLLCC